MKRKRTVVFFNPESMECVKTITFNVFTARIATLIALIIFALTVTSFVFLGRFLSERNHYLEWQDNNRTLKKQIVKYKPLLDQIQMKKQTLDTTEGRLLGIASLAGVSASYQKEPKGGPDNSALENSINYNKDDALLPIFEFLGSEIDKRIETVSGLANMIEEQELLFQSTPSGSPVNGWISSKFDFRFSPFTGKIVFHEGVDIAANYSSPVRTTAKGIVIFAGEKYGYGNLVTVDHGYGFVTRYGHNSRLVVKEGDYVERGDTIALVGSTGHSTGPHVHYEVLINGTVVNPISFMFQREMNKERFARNNRIFVVNEYN
jgi:murein DD-endopeptidase MepM/ murein hydrolase activator NlpD